MPPTRIPRVICEAAKMVSVGQDIGRQLTKPVKELAEWDFPLSQKLEKYYCSFNSKRDKSFGEAGLVLQNTTAAYVQRLDNLWNKIGYFNNTLLNVENEEVPKNFSKRKDKKTGVCFQDFQTVDFAQEVEKNIIDLKKNQITHDIIKSKSRRFTQLEKNVAQHIPIDICDVNGEVIGKKYDFRCNQNVSMDGILVDEFAPQDFYCDYGNVSKENSISSDLNYSNQTKLSESSCSETIDTVMQNIENNEAASSDAESAGNDDNWQAEENSCFASPLSESNQQNLNLSTSTDTDNTIHATNTTNNDCHEITFTSISNEIRADTPCDTSSSMITDVNNTISSNNNNTDATTIYFNDNDRQSITISSVLDSPPESVNSKERTLSTDDPMLNITEILINAKLNANLQSNSPKCNTEKTRVRSTPKTLSKPLNKKLLKPCKRKRSVTKKNMMNIVEKKLPQRDKPNMLKKSSTACLKYIQEYDSHKYEYVTNEELDFLGFRLRVSESEKSVDNIAIDNISNNNDDVMPTLSDDENSEMEFAQSSRSTDMSPLQENFCDTSFRTNSPHFMLGNVDKWHEYIQPKLREAEQRSTFCISNYTSQVMSTLKSKKKVNFDTIVQNEHPCEVARYFLASLDLASKYKIDINTSTDHQRIELVPHEGNRQSSVESDSQQ